MNIRKKLWIIICLLILFSPLGLILPAHFNAGSAWGEWSPDEIEKMLGYVPLGLEKLSSLWNAPLADYSFNGWEEKGLKHLSLSYIISAIIGMLLTVTVSILLGKIIIKKDDTQKS